MRVHNDFVAAICYELESKLSKGQTWMAYTTRGHFTTEKNMHFFTSRNAAEKFSASKKREGIYQVAPVEPLTYIMEDWFRLAYMKQIHSGHLHINTQQVIADYEKEQLKNHFIYSIKTNVMNQENLEYLKDNVKYMGFGEKMNEQLENNLQQGKDNFQLDFKSVVNNKPFAATLHFGKSETSDKYFFNSYDASLQKNNNEKVDQTFYLNKGKGITAKEAYNLLDGRAVHKELTNKENVPYKAWVQLDFEKKDKHNNFEVKQFHENYGYNLKDAVAKYAISELNDVEKEGNSHKMFIEANPQFKSVTLYDGQMKRVQKESLEQYKSVSQSQNKDVKQDVKQDQKQDVKHDVKKSAKQDITGEMNGTKKNSARRKGMSL
jgi:hypothetical protein